MNTSLGYAKRTLTDTNVLLSGGGDKPLSDFIGSISWDATNKKIQYTPVGGSATDLVTFGSLAFLSSLDSYSLREAYLLWGGKNFSGDYGPLDAAIVSELGACRTMFLRAASIVIEYSTDAGATWTDYEATDEQKVALFSTGLDFVIGKATAATASANNMLRVTMRTANLLYTVLNKFVIYVSTSGSTGSYCTIRCRTLKDYEDNVDTWITRADHIPISGWSGYNVINIANTTTYGNTKSSQYGEWQFIFGCTGHNSSSYPGLSIAKIFGFGGMGWYVPSNMARNGHIYSFDSSQNVTFPAKINAPGGTMTGTITRVYSAASDSPMLSLESANQNVWLWRVKDYATGAATDTSKVYGFGLKYLGTGSGNNSLALYSDNQTGTQVAAMTVKLDGNITFSKDITATAIIKSGGTSSQFLKADGSIDSSTYLTSSSVTDSTENTLGTLNTTIATIGGVNITAKVDHVSSGTTAGTAGSSTASSGSSLSVPYVTVNAAGHVTSYGTRTHTVTGFATSGHNHNDDYARIENTYGTTGNFANGAYSSNYIARGDLGSVGFDNSSTTVELYEAASGSSYPSSPTKTITVSDATYGVNFRKGAQVTMHTCAAGAKLKIIVKSSKYIKAVGIYVDAGGNTISFSSAVGNKTKTGSFNTYGSWHIFSCMHETIREITLELNTTNVNYGVLIGGFRTYVTNPSQLRFPGVANSADSVSWSNITDKPSAFPADTHNHEIQNLTNYSSRVYDATTSRTKNTVLAAPNGSNGTASFRALVAADIPTLTMSKISDAPSTKSFTVNGTAYSIYTSSTSLPTILAPTSYGTANYILATNANANGLSWVSKPVSNVSTAAYVSSSSSGKAQITSAQSDPYYNLVEGSNVNRSIQFKAGTGMSISSSTGGVITFTSSAATALNTVDTTLTTTVNGDVISLPVFDNSGNFTGWKNSLVDIDSVDSALYSELILVQPLNPSSLTTYYPVWSSAINSDNNHLYGNDGFEYITREGVANTVGHGILILGNSLAKTAAKNKQGLIRIYSESSGYGSLILASTTSGIVHTFPATEGTVLNTGTTSFTRNLTSGTKIGSIKINGTSTDIYCNNNTWNACSTSQAGYVPAASLNSLLYTNGSTLTWGSPTILTMSVNSTPIEDFDDEADISYKGLLGFYGGNGILLGLDEDGLNINLNTDSFSVDGVTGITTNHFVTCSTAAATAAKTVALADASLASGTRLSVKFSNANTASNPTLNLNNEGAKNIYHRGSRITTGSNKALLAGVCDLVYDGTQWHLTGNYVNTDTTYKFTIGSTTNGDSTNGVSLGSLSSLAAASGGTALSLVTTGEKYTWNSKTSNTGTVTSVTLTSGTGITVSNSGTAITISGSRTISLASGVATAGTAGTSDDTEGASIDIPYVTVDTYGRVTGYGTHTHTVTGVGGGGGAYYKTTLNNTAYGTSTGTSLGSWYAPTSGGTSGQVLKSTGSTSTPEWKDPGSFITELYVPRVTETANNVPNIDRFRVREHASGSTYNLPTNHYYHIYTTVGSNSTYATELAVPMTNDAALFVRNKRSSTWYPWVRLLDADPISMAGSYLLDKSDLFTTANFYPGNRIYGLPGENITVNAGSGSSSTTYSSTNLGTNDNRKQMTMGEYIFHFANKTPSSTTTVAKYDGLLIIIDVGDFSNANSLLYGTIRAIYVYGANCGHVCTLTIDTQAGNASTWTNVVTSELRGWDGSNIYWVNPTIYLGGYSTLTTHIRKIRIRSYISTVTTANNKDIPRICGLGLIGDKPFLAPSNIANNNHLYTVNLDMTGVFPSYVQSTGFKVTGKDDTYVLLAGGGTTALSSIGGGGGGSITTTSTTFNSSTTLKILFYTSPTSGGSITKVYYNTNFYVNNSGVFYSSDRNLKTNIKDYSTFIKDNPIKLFDWKDGTGKDNIGFIAQEVEEWCPQAVGTNEDGRKTVNYKTALSALCSFLYNKIKDLEDKLNKLEKEKA